MRRILYLLVVIILLIGGYGGWAFRQPLPLLQPASVLSSLPDPKISPLAWPGYGQTAVGAVGYGLLASNNSQKAVPTASVAKVMTALAVLDKKPLKPGEPGPLLTLNTQDTNFYHNYVAKGGSVVAVNFGEQISEYQALQGTLIASANNLAASLATWAFGSQQAYLEYAKDLATRLDLKDTRITDPSGFESSTVSTAADLVKLGQAALQNPVIAQIVAQSAANIPVAGTIQSTNRLLGSAGINGIKTGETDEAGGVYLVSGSYQLSGQSVTIIAAIMSAPSRAVAMNDSLPLMESAKANFVLKTVVKKGQIVGYYNTPWGTSAHVVSNDNLTIFGWKGTKPKIKLSMKPQRPPAKAGQVVGTISLETADKLPSSKHNLSLQEPLDQPNWKWRLFHL